MGSETNVGDSGLTLLCPPYCSEFTLLKEHIIGKVHHYVVLFYTYFKRYLNIPPVKKPLHISMHNARIQIPPQSLKFKCRMNKIKQLKINYYLNFFSDTGNYKMISGTGKPTQF